MRHKSINYIYDGGKIEISLHDIITIKCVLQQSEQNFKIEE